MRAHNTQTRNMPMLQPIRRLLLHLGQHVPDNLGILPGHIAASWLPTAVTVGAGAGVFGVSVARPHDRDETQLRPGEGVVEVVFQEVVFGEVGYIACLDRGEEVDVGGVAA